MDQASQDLPCFVGIDVAKKNLDIHLRPSGVSFTLSRDAAGLDELIARLLPRQPVLIVLAATGGYENVLSNPAPRLNRWPMSGSFPWPRAPSPHVAVGCSCSSPTWCDCRHRSWLKARGYPVRK